MGFLWVGFLWVSSGVHLGFLWVSFRFPTKPTHLGVSLSQLAPTKICFVWLPFKPARTNASAARSNLFQSTSQSNRLLAMLGVWPCYSGATGSSINWWASVETATYGGPKVEDTLLLHLGSCAHTSFPVLMFYDVEWPHLSRERAGGLLLAAPLLVFPFGAEKNLPAGQLVQIKRASMNREPPKYARKEQSNTNNPVSAKRKRRCAKIKLEPVAKNWFTFVPTANLGQRGYGPGLYSLELGSLAPVAASFITQQLLQLAWSPTVIGEILLAGVSWRLGDSACQAVVQSNLIRALGCLAEAMTHSHLQFRRGVPIYMEKRNHGISVMEQTAL